MKSAGKFLEIKKKKENKKERKTDIKEFHCHFFPWLALHVALVNLIHRWHMLEKMSRTLPVAILVAIKVLVDSVCAWEKGDLVKPKFWKRTWIFLRREEHYFKN